MTDYSSLNLNGFLQPENSPVTNAGFVDGYTFNSENERGAVNGYSIRDFAITNAKIGTAAIDNAKIATASINDANIGTLTFDTISGGTATLGGTANGEGVVSVQDSGGTERVRLDNTGLTVYDGKIAMENNAGTTFIDDKGLVNTVVANSGTTYNYGTAVIATLYGSATADGTIGTVGITVTRDTKVLILGDVTQDAFYGDGTANYNGDVHIKIKVDGTQKARNSYTSYYYAGGAINNVNEFPVSLHTFETLGSGSHTIALAGSISVTAGSPNAQLRSIRLTAYYIGS